MEGTSPENGNLSRQRLRYDENKASNSTQSDQAYKYPPRAWKANDLFIICALLNMKGGELSFIPKKGKELDALKTMIQNKVKKIGPNTHRYISSTINNKYVTVSISLSPEPCYVESSSGIKRYYLLQSNTPIQVDENTVKKYRSAGKVKKSISKLTSNMVIPDTKYLKDYTFKSGNTVPVFDAFSVYGFNRLVGYLKYINRSYANVYCRGECRLHDSLIPSLYRDKDDTKKEDEKVTLLVNRFMADSKLLDTLSLDPFDLKTSRYRIEGLLQHYGANTSFLDVVDNHWVALWMGLNKYCIKEQIERYARYEERTIPLIEKLSNIPDYQEDEKWDDSISQYVLLIAVPYSGNILSDGISESNDIVEIDLRKSLPSIFLRPHAQHGLVIKKKDKDIVEAHNCQSYDLSSNVVAIIKVRIDRAKKWIGNGELLTQDNLIPPPAYDPGYDLLLSKSSLFKGSTLKITQYI